MIRRDVVIENLTYPETPVEYADLTDGIWRMVSMGRSCRYAVVYAIVFLAKGEGDYEDYPKTFIVTEDDAFIPNPSAWMDSTWVQTNSRITVTFQKED